MKTNYEKASTYIGGAFTAMDSWAVKVHQRRCAKVRNRNVSCLKCAEACTSGCISFVDGVLSVDGSRCVGCGTCATVCPTCALESLNPTDDELLASCLEAAASRPDGKAVIVCQPALELLADYARKDSLASVVCLGRVDESTLVALESAGVSSAELVCGNCEACSQRNGLSTASMVAETARSLSRAWGGNLSVVIRNRPTAGDFAVATNLEDAQRAWDEGFPLPTACSPLRQGLQEEQSRPARNSTGSTPGDESDSGAVLSEFDDETHGTGMRFFWSSKHDRKGSRTTMHVMEDGTLPHFLPNRRERLLDALCALGQPESESVECRLWATVAIDGSRCSSCRMCATFCPTGALRKFDEPDGSFGIIHTPADCVKCGSCLDICPQGAIVVNPAVKTEWLARSSSHRYLMRERPVNLADNPHQILDTMRQIFPGDLFER